MLLLPHPLFQVNKTMTIKAIKRTAPYIFIRVVLHAAGPVHSPHVGGGHLENVQLERLLDEDDVVVRHAEAVVVAGREERAAGNRADHPSVLQRRDVLAFV